MKLETERLSELSVPSPRMRSTTVNDRRSDYKLPSILNQTRIPVLEYFLHLTRNYLKTNKILLVVDLSLFTRFPDILSLSSVNPKQR